MMGLTSALLYNFHCCQGLASTFPRIRIKGTKIRLKAGKGRKDIPIPTHSPSKPYMYFTCSVIVRRYYNNCFGLQIIKHLNGNTIIPLFDI